MKNFFHITLVLFIVSSLSSCTAIAEIFKAGFWVGVIVVVAIIVLILFLIGRGSNKS